MRNPGNRNSTTIGLLLVSLVFAGCAVVHVDTENARVATRTYQPQLQTSKHRENYLQIRGKGKSGPRFGFARAGAELFAPWNLGFTMGSFDPKATEHSLNQQGCVELDVPASNPLEFAAFCGFKTSLTGNWSLTVGYDLGGSSGQSPFVDFNNAGDRIKMKVGADALSMLRFYAKPTMAVDWTPVYELDAGGLGYDLTQDSLLPAVGGSNLNNKGEIGFKGFWLNSAPRPNPTDEETVLDNTLNGIRLNIKGIQALDDLVPDAPTALDRLNNARTHYQWAFDHVESNLPDTRDNQKARRYLGKAIQFSDKAIDKTLDGKWKPAQKKSAGAIKWGEKAAAFYLGIPIDF
jgi:hypothetical protein